MNNSVKSMSIVILAIGLFFTVSFAQKTVPIQTLLQSVEVGKQLPDKAWLIDLKGDTVRYETFKGKWLLIDFWSTGCSPCIKEFPKTFEFYQKNSENFNVIAVSVDNSFQKFSESAQKYKIQVPTYFGGFTYANPIFNLNIKVFKKEDNAVHFSTLTPQYVLINPEGKIIDKDLPKPSDIALQEKIHRYRQHNTKQ